MSVAITNLDELCRLCLEHSEMLYKLDSDFCILVMESGASVTIADAMKYLTLNVKIAPEPSDDENADESEIDEAKQEDDPSLPKSLCQDCLEKLQSAYEFKFRCEENKNFLRNYLRECADSKLAEERAVKEAALAALDLDLDNLDKLPDRLVLKDLKKDKKPRKSRDVAKGPLVRRRRIPEKNVLIADGSQVESSAYIRKIVTTPEQSPEQSRASKRKSKHVIIEDIFVGASATRKSDPMPVKVRNSNTKENETSESSGTEKAKDLPTVKKEKKPAQLIADDEPVFEDDDDFEEEEEPKRSKRLRK